MSAPAERDRSARPVPPTEGRGDDVLRIGDFWQWLGLSGEVLGISSIARSTLRYCYAVAVVVVGAFDTIDGITLRHEEPQYGLVAPIIWEGSSWLTFILFLWIPWIAYRIAPLAVRPRWKFLIHIPVALLFALAHVAGFVALRKLIYWLGGADYDFGAFFRIFDTNSPRTHSVMCCSSPLRTGRASGATTIADRRASADAHLRHPRRRQTSRVRLDQILAVVSAGNYVEFILDDGRKLLMRSPLSVLENELGPRGFVRTHRSWLVNPRRMTALKPEGSGDYKVELGSVTAPLSRRFPETLARLRSG